MNITQEDLSWAVSQEIINERQSQALWKAWNSRVEAAPKFDLVNLAYYFGAILIMLALGWFLTTCWASASSELLLIVTSIYVGGFLFTGHRLWKGPTTKVPGGLLAAVAVSLFPLIIYCFEKILGLWPTGTDPGSYGRFHVYVQGSWVAMEVLTILGGALVMRLIAYPFVLAPISVAMWYLSMDLTPLMFGQNKLSWSESGMVSLVCGLLTIMLAFWLDRRTRDSKLDFGFWLYLFGVVEFWGGVIACGKGGELGQFLFFLLNLGMLVVSVLLQRRIFAVFGSFGVIGYLCHLGYSVFQNWMLFPFLLTAVGLGVIAATIQYQKNRQAIEGFFKGLVPEGLRPYLPLTDDQVLSH